MPELNYNVLFNHASQLCLALIATLMWESRGIWGVSTSYRIVVGKFHTNKEALEFVTRLNNVLKGEEEGHSFLSINIEGAIEVIVRSHL